MGKGKKKGHHDADLDVEISTLADEMHATSVIITSENTLQDSTTVIDQDELTDAKMANRISATENNFRVQGSSKSNARNTLAGERGTNELEVTHVADTGKRVVSDNKSGKASKLGKNKKVMDEAELEREMAELYAVSSGAEKIERVTLQSARDDIVNAVAVETNSDDSMVSGNVIKTAAQKRQEKKERDREEKLKQNAKARARNPREDATQQSRTSQEPALLDVHGFASTVTEAVMEKGAAGATVDADEDQQLQKNGVSEKIAKAKAVPRKGLPSSKAVQAMKEHLRLIEEQKEKAQREEIELAKREAMAEEERIRKVLEQEEQKRKKKEKDKLRRDRLKAEGKPVTAKQKAENARNLAFLEQRRAQGVVIPQPGEKIEKTFTGKTKEKPVITQHQPPVPLNNEDVYGEDNDDNATTESENEGAVNDWEEYAVVTDVVPTDTPTKLAEISQTSMGRPVVNDAVDLTTNSGAKKSNLRAPIVCVLGHVDTGKTKILDYIRKTHVQDAEAGGITQQIGATEVPAEAIKKQASMVREFVTKEIRLPGMLIIDTPGHEAFTNLRSRGSSMCDIAILVVDLMHGLEQQTIESINLLKSRKTPFIVALNKVDRLYQWKSMNERDIRDVMAAQPTNTQGEFRKRVDEVIAEFAVQGLNVRLFYENPNPREFLSAVPTSAHSGDGMGNLMALLVDLSQTLMVKRLAVSADLQCTVMEVKSLPGLGTTIDVILVNGKLREGDTIIVAGQEGPIVTSIRGLLMPQPLHELRVRNEYMHFQEVTGAQGLKIIAKDLEKAVAGLPLLVAANAEEVELHKRELQKMLASVLKCIKVSDRGVYVQASTIGSLEALLEFLRTSKVAYCGINIGPVHKADIRKAAVMLEHDPKYAAVLAFDVRIDKEAQQLADELNVKIFSADIIYHLFDNWTKYTDELRQRAKEEFRNKIVFPARLKILPDHVYGRRDPIIVGVRVEAGRLRLRTPVCVPSKEMLEIGVVTSIESNHKQLDVASTGDEVCIRIDNTASVPKLFGRHFDENDSLVSRITRESIDLLKEYYRDDMEKTDWQLIIELKKELNIF